MEKSIRASILLGLGLALAPPLLRGQPPLQEGLPFVPGQVIVKLSAECAGGRALAQADRDHLESDAGLAKYLADMSRKAAVPLGIERLTSGGELVLAIDLGELRSDLLARLRSDQRVESAQERKITPGTGLVELGIEVLVRFKAGSDAAAAVQRSHVEDLEASPEFQTLVRDLVGISGYQPEARIVGGSELILGVDLRQLTKHLAAWLKGRPDVEYAQLNILLQAFG